LLPPVAPPRRLPRVDADVWNGLALTLILAIGGLVLGFPGRAPAQLEKTRRF
jgi:hypothetical protein